MGGIFDSKHTYAYLLILCVPVVVVWRYPGTVQYIFCYDVIYYWLQFHIPALLFAERNWQNKDPVIRLFI